MDTNLKLCKRCGAKPPRRKNSMCQDCDREARRIRREEERQGEHTMPICSHCGKSRRAPGMPYCRECTNLYAKVRRERAKGNFIVWGRPEVKLRDPNTKHCNACGRVLVKSLFPRDKSRLDGYKTICKLCTRDSGRAWSQRNRDKVNDSCRRYRKRHAKEIMARLNDKRKKAKLEKLQSVYRLKLKKGSR